MQIPTKTPTKKEARVAVRSMRVKIEQEIATEMAAQVVCKAGGCNKAATSKEGRCQECQIAFDTSCLFG